MNLDQQTLESITRMGAAAFTLLDIADTLETDVGILKIWMEDKTHPFYKAYRKGILTRQLELRERIFKDARNGSSPAQTIASKLLDDLFIKTTL